MVERYYDPENNDVVEYVDHDRGGNRNNENENNENKNDEGEVRRPYNGGTRREEE